MSEPTTTEPLPCGGDWCEGPCPQKTPCRGREHERGEVARPEATDIIARIDRELAHPVMTLSGSGEVDADLLTTAKAEIFRLRAALVAARDVINWTGDDLLAGRSYPNLKRRYQEALANVR